MASPQPHQPSAQPAQPNVARELLERAHSPDTSERIFTERVKQKPLFLRPTSPTPEDNRSRRRLHRLRKKEYFLRKQKPKPLTAREKRVLGIHALPKEEVRYDIFKSLNEMWAEYMREILGIGKQSAKSPPVITSTNHGSLLVSADYHGAEMEVVRSRCVSRVGVKGFVVRDSKFAFVLVTEKNEMKTIPKEHTVFRFEIPLPSSGDEKEQKLADPEGDIGSQRKPGEKKNLVFELHGSQFENRPADRANKKFKWRNLDYI